MNSLIAWLVAFMTAQAPVNRPQYIPDAKETPEETTARYQSIAADIASVVWNTKNPPLFSGPDGRAKTASVILAIMSFESGFRKDVDLGLGPQARGDNGRSWCMMQLNIGTGKTWKWNIAKQRGVYPNDPKEEIVDGWTGPEVIADRKKCIEAGYRVMKISFAACRHLPVADWLRVYASGSCDEGAPQSQRRMNLGVNWFNSHKPTFTEAEAFAFLNSPANGLTMSSGVGSQILAVSP